jgi:hypothetical protein
VAKEIVSGAHSLRNALTGLARAALQDRLEADRPDTSEAKGPTEEEGTRALAKGKNEAGRDEAGPTKFEAAPTKASNS